MTDDPDLGRLLAAVARAKAKLIVVGDDRQLSAVGPGGGLGALLARHPERVWKLTVNVRQHDPDKRHALAELRAGNVERAVAWYARAGRVVAALGRDAAIAAMVAAWSADVAAWQEPLLLAWRRADVDDLNTAARAAWDRLGRLSGPELEAPGGKRYRFGDRVLMLSPGPAGAWVTSEHATIVGVNLAERSLTSYTPDGRVLHLDTDAIGAERLTHAYALTVHRAQGVTADTAHVLDNGGGRELAYVAMSRARGATRVYVPAGDLDDAAEQLRWSWTDERRQRWAHDQGQPQPQPDIRRLLREFDRLNRFIDRQVFAATGHSGFARVQRRTAIDAEIDELETGTGRHAHTPEGHASRALADAERALNQARREGADALGPFARRRDRKLVDEREAERAVAQQQWNQLVTPELDHLRAERDQTLVTARNRSDERDVWLADHPAIHQRFKALARDIGEHPERDVGSHVHQTQGQAIDLGL